MDQRTAAATRSFFSKSAEKRFTKAANSYSEVVEGALLSDRESRWRFCLACITRGLCWPTRRLSPKDAVMLLCSLRRGPWSLHELCSVLANQDAFALASKSNEVAWLPSLHTLRRATSECKKHIGRSITYISFFYIWNSWMNMKYRWYRLNFGAIPTVSQGCHCIRLLWPLVDAACNFSVPP